MKSKKSKIMKTDIEALKKDTENELIKNGYSTDETKKMDRWLYDRKENVANVKSGQISRKLPRSSVTKKYGYMRLNNRRRIKCSYSEVIFLYNVHLKCLIP